MTAIGLSARRAVRRLSSRLRTEEHGAVTVIVAFSMTVILGMAALVVDVGASEVRKAQLQDASDAAATAIAELCFGAAGTTVNACDGGVIAAASSTALSYAQRTMPNDTVSVASVVFTVSTVKVALSSDQDSIFAQIFNVSSTGVGASATAQWGLPATPLPLAYNECALPAPSATTKQFLRYDLLDLSFAGCGLIGGITDLLGPGWLSTGSCTFDLDLVTYVVSTLSKVLPTYCASMVSNLIGKYVLLPVYNHVLTNIVINGVLLGQGYTIQKYALMQVTGYDFQTLNVNALGIGVSIGPADISGNPQCPSVDLLHIVDINSLLCQGLQGYLQGFLTPAEASARMHGVQLIA
jgi:Flp pilus assembly protein TadG